MRLGFCAGEGLHFLTNSDIVDHYVSYIPAKQAKKSANPRVFGAPRNTGWPPCFGSPPKEGAEAVDR